MAGQKYKYEEEHKKIYHKMLEAIPLKDYIKQTKKHGDAWTSALEVLKGKGVAHIDDGIELLTDAVIAYRRAANLPFSDDPKHRHYVVSEIRHILNDREFSKGLGEDPEKMLKEGNAHIILTQILQLEKDRDLEGKLDYEMRKILSPDKDFDFYHGIAHYYASLRPTLRFSKGKLTKMSSQEGIVGAIKSAYKQEISNQLEDHKTDEGYKTKKRGTTDEDTH
ncbi:MAG: hypothetical protein Q7J54_05055 [Candidatus Woesearchaeota archaeon]|nr:hypothetical protein [Candidatus Woesearchaeota archaeon]